MSQESPIHPRTAAPIVPQGSQPQFIYVYPADAPLPAAAKATDRPHRSETPSTAKGFSSTQDWWSLALKRETLATVSAMAVVLFAWSWLNHTIAEVKHSAYFEGYNTALTDAQQRINQAKAAQALAEAKQAQAQSTVAQIQAIVSTQPTPTPAPVPVPVPSPAPAQ